MIQRRGAGTQHLQHQGLPAVDGQAVLVALAAERQRALAPAPGGSGACRGRPARRARAGRPPPSRPARADGRAPPRSASGGTKTCRAREAARASTAAASAALPQLAIANGAWAPEAARPGLPSTTARYSSSPIRWRALCEPATLPVSSLTHTSSPRRSPRAASRAEGRDAQSRGRRPQRSASSSRRTRLDEVGVAQPARARRMPGVQALAVAHERVGARRRGRARRRRPSRCSSTCSHVVLAAVARRRRGSARRRPARQPQPTQTRRIGSSDVRLIARSGRHSCRWPG